MTAAVYALAPDAIVALKQVFRDAELAWDPRVGTRTRFVPAIAAAAALRRWHRPVLAATASQPVLGITLGEVVYVRDADALAKWPLVAHECAHVAQVMRRGTWRFLARYGVDYARGRARGLAHHAAYLAIPDEVEARRIEAVARAHRRPDPLLIPTP